MPSLFPGLDPFIEAQDRWHSFHTSFITVCTELLNARLPENYFATVEERVLLDATGPQDVGSRQILHRLGPDAAVHYVNESPESSHTPDDAAGGVATLMPRMLPQTIVSLDQPTQKLVEIRGLTNHELVTTIELLSPSNKRNGEDRTAYLAKRADLLRHGVNTVDLDLLLAGQRLPMLVPLPPGDYHAFVTRATAAKTCEVYSWAIRSVLPAIAVPLKSSDRDVLLDLQTAFTHVYDRNRYAGLIRHDLPVPSAFSSEDREWVAKRVASSSSVA